MKKNTVFITLFCLTLLLLSSCGVGQKIKDFHKPVDLRNEPLDPDERARRNIEEGRGISLGNLGSNNTNYEFSTSNPMWRASLETLDFIPLSTVDYSGGMIITDWYSTSKNQTERCKLNIFISGKDLKTENLKVTSFCQEFKNQIWVGKEVGKEKNIKIENAILNKAKKLKIQSS